MLLTTLFVLAFQNSAAAAAAAADTAAAAHIVELGVVDTASEEVAWLEVQMLELVALLPYERKQLRHDACFWKKQRPRESSWSLLHSPLL